MALPSKIESIYIDEAGNTGPDLLNTDQPAFILASNNFSKGALEELCNVFGRDSELHFKKLKESGKGRESLIKFLNHPLITTDNIISLTAHKEYCAVAQIVDQLIEPVFYDNGIDLYKHGENIALSNFILHFGNFFWNKKLYKEMIADFMMMMREKTPTDVFRFYETVSELYKSISGKHKELLIPVLESSKQIYRILQGIDKFTLDITLSSFYTLCDLWYKKTGLLLHIKQDESKQIDHYRSYVEFTRSLNVPKTDVGFDSRKIIFPTQIHKLELVSSEYIKGVQVSDLLASSLAFMYNNKNAKQQPFVEAIKASKLVKLDNYFTIWPSAGVTPEELKMQYGEGQNILDFLTSQM